MSARKSESPSPARARQGASRPAAPAAGTARRSPPGRAAASGVEAADETPRRRKRANGAGDGNGHDAGNGGNGGAQATTARGLRTVARAGESRRGRRDDGDLERLAEGLRRLREGDFAYRLGASRDPAFAEVFAL